MVAVFSEELTSWGGRDRFPLEATTPSGPVPVSPPIRLANRMPALIPVENQASTPRPQSQPAPGISSHGIRPRYRWNRILWRRVAISDNLPPARAATISSRTLPQGPNGEQTPFGIEGALDALWNGIRTAMLAIPPDLRLLMFCTICLLVLVLIGLRLNNPASPLRGHPHMDPRPRHLRYSY